MLDEPSADPETADVPRRGSFPATRWTLVARLSDGTDADAGEARAALEDLCQLYWFPLYAFARGNGRSAEDAEDLTQGYFSKLLEKGIFGRARQEKGKLRSFLLVTFKRYIADQVELAGAQKRGGGAPVFSINQEEAEFRYSKELSHRDSPDRLFDRRWALAVLDQVITVLREEYELKGRGEIFAGLKEFLAGSVDVGSQQKAARELGMTENNVRVSVFRLRRRYGELLREHIADTLQSSNEIADEIDYLMAALGETQK